MNFEDIFKQWERSSRSQKKQNSRFDNLYEKYAPTEEDLQKDEGGAAQPTPGPAAQALEPEDTLDLHGLTAEEAERQVLEFLEDASRRGLRKVLIIHGKGHHSQSREPVLKRVVRTCLERSPHAGKSGRPKRELGGSGAVWVMIKR